MVRATNQSNIRGFFIFQNKKGGNSDANVFIINHFNFNWHSYTSMERNTRA